MSPANVENNFTKTVFKHLSVIKKSHCLLESTASDRPEVKVECDIELFFIYGHRQ
jgi:hypothetical protein